MLKDVDFGIGEFEWFDAVEGRRAIEREERGNVEFFDVAVLLGELGTSPFRFEFGILRDD